MMFPPQFLDEIRARVSLADTIGRRVRLTRRGREHVGLCPFHNEKTPSFTVSEDKGFFHCFGCGEHGDVIGFVMRTDNLTCPEAVERRAEAAGLPVPRRTPGDKARGTGATRRGRGFKNPGAMTKHARSNDKTKPDLSVASWQQC